MGVKKIALTCLSHNESHFRYFRFKDNLTKKTELNGQPNRFCIKNEV